MNRSMQISWLEYILGVIFMCSMSNNLQFYINIKLRTLLAVTVVDYTKLTLWN